jgi:hypothetical protein
MRTTNNVTDHYCEKIKEAALNVIVQVLESHPSPETIDYEFVARLDTKFREVLEGEGGGGVQFFDILEIVGYAYPEKLQGTRGFKLWHKNISDVKGLCRVLCIKGLTFRMKKIRKRTVEKTVGVARDGETPAHVCGLLRM